MKNLKEKNKSIIEKKEDIMSYERETGKNEKEVRKLESERQQKERLLAWLNSYWELANDTKHTRKFRAQRLSKMIQYITAFIDDNPQQLLEKDERYILLSLIKWVSFFQVEKSAENKEAIEWRLESYEALVEKTEGEKIKWVN